MTTPLLWHFPISHYNEKVRWALDWKGIAHRRVTLGASYLVRAWWATGTAKLPILQIDGASIGDSTHIIAALEARHPEPPLYPADLADRKRALAIEDWFDEEIGDPIRSFLVGSLVRRNPRDAIEALATGIPNLARMVNSVRPVFQRFYDWRHAIDDAAIDAAPVAIEAAFARIETERKGGDYLVGDAFSVADLTAASILGPLLRPPELEYPPAGDWPEPVEALRERLADHPAWAWLLEVWRRHRGTSMEVRA